MKYHRFAACLFAFLASLAGFAVTTPTDEGVPLNIDVRATVDRKWEGIRKLAKVAHGRVYALAVLKEVEVAEKLIKPVDRTALAVQLRQEMAARGFREITAEETPEIVLTVNYGRGFLRNPYLADAMVDEATPGTPTATMTSPKQIMRQRGFDGEGKLQRAQEEKLYISVTAWKYPEKKGDKPNQLWRTVMVTDNPDGRDLNLAMPAMLAAGVGYFDQDIQEAEVTIKSTMPTGTVKLGPLEVIEGVKPRK